MENMKSSQYNIILEDSSCGEIILFNALYGSITIWEKSGFQIAKQLLDNPNSSIQDETTKFVLQNLKDGQYIIDDKVNEIKIIEKRKVSGIKDKNYLNIIILPNMTCNFACPYCFESHIPDSFMSVETELAIKKLLKLQIPNYKIFSLSWFGGEPLLSFERIISMTKFCKEVCNYNNISFSPSITTNGYLFDKNRVKKLIDIGIFNYYITLDGPPEIHNKTRFLKDGRDSFWKIFENILLLVRADNRVHITLRVNFNHNNIYKIPELLALFPEDVRSNLSMLYEPIFGDKCLSATENISSEKIGSETINNYQLAQKMGYKVRLWNIEVGKLTYCASERENHFTINYNGDIFKCNVNYDRKNRLGYIDSNGNIVYNEKQKNKWFGVELFDRECYSCIYLPLCMGGCRNMRITNANRGNICSLIPQYTESGLKKAAYDVFK